MMSLQRQKQKANTKRQIIDAAINLFARDGLTAARTSDIASTAKVSHGTVFAHFQTRDTLLDAAIEEFGARIINRLHELVNENCGLKEVLEAHLKGIGEYEIFYTRMVLESRLLGQNSRNTLIAIQSAISFHISQIAEKEMKASKIKVMPIDLLFNSWIGLVHHYLVNGDLFAPDSSVIERYSKQLVEHYIALVTK
jgi:AcrR family transcriptional regulator